LIGLTGASSGVLLIQQVNPIRAIRMTIMKIIVPLLLPFSGSTFILPLELFIFYLLEFYPTPVIWFSLSFSRLEGNKTRKAKVLTKARAEIIASHFHGIFAMFSFSSLLAKKRSLTS